LLANRPGRSRSNEALRLAAFALAIGMITGCAAPSAGAQSSSFPPLVEQLRTRMTDANPRLQTVRVLDLASLGEDAGAPYLAIVRGLADQIGTPPDFTNELFMIMELDPLLTQVVEVLDQLPTPRWRDTRMWIEDVDADSVTIAWQSETYRDEPFRRSYPNPSR